MYQNLLYMQAMWGAAAAVAALVERQRSGRGQTVTVDGVHAVLVAAVSALVIDPTAELDSSNVGPGGKNPWYTRYECSDGQWLFVGALIEKFQRATLRVLGLDGLPADERVAGGWDQFLSAANRGWLSENLAAALALRPRDEWLERLEAGGCPTGPLLRRDDWLDHPQIRALGMAVEVEDPAVGPTLMPGIPLQLSLTPGTVAAGRPVAADAIDWTPRPDPEGSVHLGAVQSGEVQSGGAHRRGDEARGPLAGIRIADLGTILAGPFTGSLLADLGADVVKVEPIEGDSFRAPGLQYNRGMRSLAIDLKAEEGCRLFTTLVESLDVVIDNYRPGVGERLGVDYTSLVPVNPAIITLSISGFGDCGPLRHLPGFDPILQSMSGMMSAQGGAGVPCALSFAITDVAAATMSTLGVCAALLHRGRTGEGQRIVNTLAGMSAFIQSGELVRFAGRPPAYVGGPDFAGPGPLDRYYAATDEWIRVHARPSDVPALQDLGWLPAGAASAGPDAVAGALATAIAGLAADDVVARLGALGIPAVVARRVERLPYDAELIASGALVEDRLGDGTPVFLPGRFARFSRTERQDILRPPGLGEHSREILGAAGVDAGTVDKAVEAGIVGVGGPMSLEIFPLFR